VISRRAVEVALVLVGVGVSAYLTAVHYARGVVPLACAQGSVVNCEAVTTSAASTIGPLPVALLGLLWFGATLVLVSVPAKRMAPIAGARLGWTLLGLLFVFYLVYAELFLIGAICLWCTVVHVVVIVLFLVELAAFVDQATPWHQ
jgi:uncharacterized membrane protein